MPVTHETCLDAIVLPRDGGIPVVCTLELGHELPHSNGDVRWIAG